MEPLREVARTVRDHWRRSTARRALAPLEEHPEPPVQALRAGLEAWLRDAHGEEPEVQSLERHVGALAQVEGRLAVDTSSLDGAHSVETPIPELVASDADDDEGRLLHAVARSLAPEGSVELGTRLGIAAAYQGTALVAGGSGCLVTVEPSPALAEAAIGHLAALGLTDRVRVVTGAVDDVLDDVLADLRPVQLVHFGRSHDGDATLAHFQRLLPALDRSAVVVVSALRRSADSEVVWGRLAHDSTVSVAVDLGDVGIVVVGPRHGDPVRIDARLD